MLSNLRQLHKNPPSLNVSVSPEVQNSLIDLSNVDQSYPMTGAPIPDISMEGIDWIFSVDDTQIHWDIGGVEQPEEPGDQ